MNVRVRAVRPKRACSGANTWPTHDPRSPRGYAACGLLVFRRPKVPRGTAGPVPASAYNVAAQLLATEAGVDAHPAQARVHLGGGTWLTVRADRLEGPEQVEQRDIVVTMEASSPTERRDIFSRSHGLTRRETEVFRHIADGYDTRTVARLMSISELAAQDHLKAVFTKSFTSSRRELLAVSLGR